MDYVFVKDSEGYVFKKLANEVSADEKIITEKEYMKKWQQEHRLHLVEYQRAYRKRKGEN